MAEYIEREAAIEYLTLNMGWNDEDGYPVDDWDERKANIADLINGIPAADVRPVVRAHWRRYSPFTDTYECSNCGEQVIDQQFRTNFCPNCGARMEEQT